MMDEEDEEDDVLLFVIIDNRKDWIRRYVENLNLYDNDIECEDVDFCILIFVEIVLIFIFYCLFYI